METTVRQEYEIPEFSCGLLRVVVRCQSSLRFVEGDGELSMVVLGHHQLLRVSGVDKDFLWTGRSPPRPTDIQWPHNRMPTIFCQSTRKKLHEECWMDIPLG
jgi:hypothetical protein